MLISRNKFFKGLALVLAVLMILPAVLACTDEAAQQSISEIKDSMLTEQDVKDIITAVLAANPGLTAEEVGTIVTNATQGLASSSDIDKSVADALKGVPTQESISNAINAAIKDLPNQAAIDKAVADALKDIPTQESISNAINEAIKDLPNQEAMDKAVADALKDLPTQEAIDKAIADAIKDAMEKAEAEDNAQAEADAAAAAILNAKITEVKAKIEVLRATYDAKKGEFSAADYAAIITLISTVSSNVGIAKTVEEVDAAYAKLEEDLKAYSGYGLTLYTKWATLNGNIVAGKTDADEDSLAAVTEYQNLVKEAIAYYGKTAGGYDHLRNYVYGYANNGTPLTIDLINAAGFPTITATSITFDQTNATIVFEEGADQYKSLAYQYYDAFKKAAKSVAEALVKSIADLDKKYAELSLADSSQQSVVALRDRYNALHARFFVKGGLSAADSYELVTNKSVLEKFETRIRTLKLAEVELMYLTVDSTGAPLTSTYEQIRAKNYLSNWNRYYDAAERALAEEVMLDILTWAEKNEIFDFDSTKAVDKVKFTDLLKKTYNYNTINYFFPDFANTYFGVQNLVRANDAYKKLKADIKLVATYNTLVENKVMRLAELDPNHTPGANETQRTVRESIEKLANDIISHQKFKNIKYNSGKKYYEENSNTSIGVSGTVKMLKAAVEELAAADSDFLNKIDADYIGLSGTVNGITYAGFKTSTSDAGRFLVGFNATITEYMFADWTPANETIKAFEKAAKDINVIAAISTEEAIKLYTDILVWLKQTEEATGFNYEDDSRVAAAKKLLHNDVKDDPATPDVNERGKIQQINDKVEGLKTSASNLVKEIEKINHKDHAKRFNKTAQKDAELTQIDTLDMDQINSAWELYTKFIAAGGSALLEAQDSKADKIEGYQTYTYKSFVDNTKLEKLAADKMQLEACIAAAKKFTDAYALINGESSKLYSGVDLTKFDTYDMDKETDKYFLGYTEVVKVNGENKNIWIREMTIVEALEAIKAAYLAFDAINNGKQYSVVEEYVNANYDADSATAGVQNNYGSKYAQVVFAYVQAMAIDTIEATGAADGLIFATVSVIKDAKDQAALDVALTHFNSVSGLGVEYAVTVADFGL